MSLLLAHTEMSQFALVSRSTLLHEPLSLSFGPILCPLSSAIVPRPCSVTRKSFPPSPGIAHLVPVVTESGTSDGAQAGRAYSAGTTRGNRPPVVTQGRYTTKPTQETTPVQAPAIETAEHPTTMVPSRDHISLDTPIAKPEGENQRPGRGGYTLAHVVHWDSKTLKAIEVCAMEVVYQTVSLTIDPGSNEGYHGEAAESQSLLVTTGQRRSSRSYRRGAYERERRRQIG